MKTTKYVQETLVSLINEQNIVSEERVLEILKTMPNYCVKRFSGQIDEDMKFDYEYWISTLGLRFAKGFKLFYPKYLKNPEILEEIRKILENDLYATGRDGFLYVLQENKLDQLFVKIVLSHSEFFDDAKLRFVIIYTLCNRKIRGFKNVIQKFFSTLNKRKDGAGIYNLCQKYLSDSVKYKRNYQDILITKIS